jgi:hypothetical protein
MKKIRLSIIGTLLLLVLSTGALAGDLGDGFYLHNVDAYSDVLEVRISSAEMSQVLNHYSSSISPKLANIGRTFYTKFDDEYDFLVFVCLSNLGDSGNGSWYTLNNDVTGIGLELGRPWYGSGWQDSPSKLKGSLFIAGENGIFNGVLLHEIGHKWIAHIFSSEIDSLTTHQLGGSHWGLSNAGGVLGGFKEVKEVGSNRYQGSIDNKNGFGLTANFGLSFSDIELYLMGLKSAEELRANNFRLNIYTGGSVNSQWDQSPDGYFTATGMNSYSIDDIIAKYGARNSTPKHFKAAVIALTDGSITPNYSRLVSGLRWFASGMNDNSYRESLNFAKATGGRASIEISGLRAGGSSKPDPDPNPNPGNNDSGGGGGCNAGAGMFAILLAVQFLLCRRGKK